MFVIISAIVVGLSTLWVYWDATQHKIGKTEKNKFSAGAYATATLLLWIIGFPYYLIRRKKLIQEAKEHPVEPKARWFKFGVFLVLAAVQIFGWVAVQIYAWSLNYTSYGYPKCFSQQAKAEFIRVIDNAPFARTSGLSVVLVEDQKYVSGSDDGKIMTCSASILFNNGATKKYYFTFSPAPNGSNYSYLIKAIPEN